MTKNILLTVNTSWNLTKFRKGLIRSLQTDGHDVSGLSPRDETVDVLEEWAVQMHHLDMDSKGMSPIKDMGLLLLFRKHFKQIKPDLVLGFTIKNNIYGAIAARSLGIPFIPNVTGLGSAFLGKPWLVSIVEKLYRYAFQKCPVVFFQNDDDMKLFVDRGLVQQGQAQRLPGSGINLKEFNPTALPNKDGVCFLQIGRLLGDKGVREFIAAAKIVREQYPAARFQMLGGQSFGNRTSISENELAVWQSDGIVEFLGEASDVRPFIDAADCICLASYREGLPRTLLEGGAMARPIIATDVPGCRALVIDGKNGFLSEVKNASALADAMIKMIEIGHKRRTKMGLQSRQMIEDAYDERLVFAAYKTAIKKLD